MKLTRTFTFSTLLVVASSAIHSNSKLIHGNELSANRPLDFGMTPTSRGGVTPTPRGAVIPAPRGGGVISASKKASILMALLLAFNSGFVNGCCLSGAATADGSKQAVAAVTASWTNSAMGLASGNMAQFKFLSKVIISFLSGSAIAGYLNPNPIPFSLEGSPFASSFYVGAALLVLAAKRLGNSNTVKTGFYLAAMANGIQNSVTSTLTQNLCRTSHFTGITSDMGTFLGQILRGNKDNLFKLQVFTGLAACFWAGGFVSFTGAKKYGNSCLFASAGLYILVGALYSKCTMLLSDTTGKAEITQTKTMQKKPIQPPATPAVVKA